MPGYRPWSTSKTRRDPDRRRACTLLPVVKAPARHAAELHSHVTIGLSPLTYSIAPTSASRSRRPAAALGNGSSLPEARRTVANPWEMGHASTSTTARSAPGLRLLDRLAAVEELPVGKPQDFDAAFLNHQIAGGGDDDADGCARSAWRTASRA